VAVVLLVAVVVVHGSVLCGDSHFISLSEDHVLNKEEQNLLRTMAIRK
jgi:hypothetical protein